MWIGVITIFPEMFVSMSNYGIISKSIKNGNINLCLFDPKYFIKNFLIDNRPYSNTPGILVSFEILKNIVNYAKFESKNFDTKVIYLSPKGNMINQNLIIDILSYKSIIFLSGRYEGIDERMFNFFIDYEISIGDFVLSGGEFIVMFLIDCISRLFPKVLGNKNSIFDDSFIEYIFDSPHYTKPKLLYNMFVPKILLSGNHFFLEIWNIKNKLGCTFFKRRDLFNHFKLSKIQYLLLRSFILENREK